MPVFQYHLPPTANLVLSRALLSGWVGVFTSVPLATSGLAAAQTSTNRVSAQPKLPAATKLNPQPKSNAPPKSATPGLGQGTILQDPAAARRAENDERKRLRLELQLHNQRMSNPMINPSALPPATPSLNALPSSPAAYGGSTPASVPNPLTNSLKQATPSVPIGAAIDFGAPPPVTGGDRRGLMSADERQELRRQIAESRRAAQQEAAKRGGFQTPTEVER